VPDGFRIMIRRSKTDQTGEGQEIVVPRGAKIRPVQAVQEWLQAAQISEGLLFRVCWRGAHVKPGGPPGHDVARLVKHYARLAGLDPTGFSGHSLRAGFATSAAETGGSVLKIMETTRHKSVDVLAAYVRRVEASSWPRQPVSARLVHGCSLACRPWSRPSRRRASVAGVLGTHVIAFCFARARWPSMRSGYSDGRRNG
jgi:hypothetical protein